MGTLIGYIFSMLFALFAFLLFVFFLVSDFVRTKEYMQASRKLARVNRYIGDSKTSNYGFFQAATKYYGYDVTYMMDGTVRSGIFLSKSRTLKEGDTVEIRCITSKEGVTKIVNRNIKDRFVRFLLCAVIAIVFSVVYYAFLR